MSESSSNNQAKLIAVASLIVLLGIAGVGYLWWASGRVDGDLADREARAQELIDEFEASQPTATRAPATEPTPVEPGLAPGPGEVLVVNRIPGDDYGRLAIRHADGSRTLLDRTCLRVHIAADRGVCLSQEDTLVPSFRTTFFEAINPAVEVKSYASALPSRARISPDGTVGSVTAFVTGVSYSDIGGEATTIVTIDDIDGNIRLRGANQFEVETDESGYNELGADYWGMSFVDEDNFYITGFYGGDPEVMRGSLSTMTVEPTGWIGSCPSVSPDGKTVVFKELRDDGGFDLVAVDVATERRWALGETRSVDDQVEWLDNDTILYALHPEGGDQPVQPEFDIWMVDIAEGSEPVLFLPNADSPAVVR